MNITIKAARVNANDMKQSDAAAALGITKERLCRIEQGKSKPNALLVRKMCELYKVKFEDLIF